MRRASLPFVLKRSSDTFGKEITSTTETIHGLLVLDGDRVMVQWRASRSTDRFGAVMRTDREVDGVKEVTIPLAALAGAQVRRRWWGHTECQLIATDLAAFDAVAGAEGLALDHPAEFVVKVRAPDRTLAEEFAAEIALAIAEREERRTLGSGDPAGQFLKR